MSTIAIVQTAPVFLDKTATIQLAVAKIEQAVEKGASLIIFSETFIPGYPNCVWRLKPGADWDLSQQLHQRVLENAVVMQSDDLLPLYAAAKKHAVTIVCGL